MLDERQLLLALRQRDPIAFTQLFNSYSDKIYRLAIGLLGNEAEAEGIVQDTFMRLLERLEQFEGRAKLATWLYRVAYNLCIDRLRKRRPTLTLADETDDDETLPMPVVFYDWRNAPERWMDADELTQEMDRAIADLSDNLKAVFILREIEGVSTQETAQILSISDSATKVRLHRARLALRERLAEYVMEFV